MSFTFTPYSISFLYEDVIYSFLFPPSYSIQVKTILIKKKLCNVTSPILFISIFLKKYFQYFIGVFPVFPNIFQNIFPIFLKKFLLLPLPLRPLHNQAARRSQTVVRSSECRVQTWLFHFLQWDIDQLI